MEGWICEQLTSTKSSLLFIRWSLLCEAQIFERDMLLCQRLSLKAHLKRRIDLMKYVYDADCHHDALYSQADES